MVHGGNWVGDMAPLPGDNLVFPAGAARLENINDYPAGTTFGSIVVSGSGYRFHVGDSFSTSLEVQTGAQLEADNIITSDLTIDAGATLTIAPIAGGPLAADSAFTPFSTRALQLTSRIPIAQPTTTNTVAIFLSTATSAVNTEPLGANAVLLGKASVSGRTESAPASSDSLSNTVLDAVVVPTPIVADTALLVRLAESTATRLSTSANNHRVSRSPDFFPDRFDCIAQDHRKRARTIFFHKKWKHYEYTDSLIHCATNCRHVWAS